VAADTGQGVLLDEMPKRAKALTKRARDGGQFTALSLRTGVALALQTSFAFGFAQG
jgi:hypothetical protein